MNVKRNVKYFLKGKVPKGLEDSIPRAFEVIGDIAIVEISEELKIYEKEIGQAILQTNASLKVVLKKLEVRSGVFRTQKLEHLAGENRKETLHTENKVKFLVNVEQVYFSSKLSLERQLLSSKVKKNSSVLVMFSGCGAYTFNILKQQPNVKKICSIELNPEAHKYALKNLELNKNFLKKSEKFKETIQNLRELKKYVNEKKILNCLLKNTLQFYCGDVREIILKEKYDEIFMPLPKSAKNFLKYALNVAKKNSIIHFYDFSHENEFPQKTKSVVKNTTKSYSKEIKILEVRKVGYYAPGKMRVCCDFEVLN